MDRRTFITLVAGGLCLASRIPVSGAAIASELSNSAAEEPYPISFEDYQTVDTDYVPRLVDYETDEPRGTIIVDPDNRFLYLVLGGGRAKRYGIGVGREGFGWAGTALIKRKAKWPSWVPPEDMQLRDKEAAKWRNGMPGGPKNPLGARALYLYQGKVDTLYRIHGTSEPGSIGRAVSSGCIRMLNPDIVELFDRVPLGTRVVVLPKKSPAAREANQSIRSPRKRKKTQAVSDRSRFIERRQRERTIFGLFGFQED